MKLFLTFAFLLACSSSSTPSDGGTDAQSSADASTDAAQSDSGGGGCPTVVLPTSMPLTYDGDTTGKADLVSSTRLEWADAPDDALLFVAPSAGTYVVAMTKDPSTNGGCGASAQDFANAGTSTCYDESACPTSGAARTIDGVYTATGSSTTPLTLTSGQHVLLFVSCTTWSSAQSGAYTLTITKQ